MKRFFKSCVCFVLILALLQDISVSAIDVSIHALSSTPVVTEGIVRNYQYNELPEKETPQIHVNEPDIGEKTDKFKNITSTNGDYKATIYENTLKNGIQIKKDLQSVRVTPDGGSFDFKAGTDRAVRYTDVFDGVDYQFASQSGRLQTKIILKKMPKIDSFCFNLNKSLFITEKPSVDGVVFAGLWEELFSLSAPVIKDSDGVEGEALFTLKDGKLNISANEEWIQSYSRAYPLELSFTLGEYVQEPPAAHSLEKSLTLSAAATIDSPYKVMVGKGLFDSASGKMDIGTVSVDGELPESDGNITLKIGDLDPVTIKEAKTESNPTPSVNWPYEIDLNSLTTRKKYLITLIVDGTEFPLDTILIYDVTNRLTRGGAFPICHKYNADLEAFIKDNGISGETSMITTGSRVLLRNPEFENINVGDPSEAELDEAIAWMLDKGVNDIKNFGLEPINYSTGNYVLQETDIKLPDYGGEFTVNRTYNSISSNINGLLGYGWSFQYDINLYRRDEGAFCMSLGDGRMVLFKPEGSGFVAADGQKYTFKVDEGYKVTDNSSKSVYHFAYDGSLITITDRYGYKTKFTYKNGLISSITNAAEYKIEISYENGRIKFIELPNGKKAKYNYNNQELTQIIDPEGYETTYAYDIDHRLLTVTDHEGRVKVKNTYDGNGRVETQNNGSDNGATVTYEDNKTTIQNSNGKDIRVIKYDEKGNKTEETDADGTVTSYEYNDNQITKITREDGTYTAFQYKNGQIVSERDFRGNHTYYEYDDKDNLIKITFRDGSTINYGYNEKNQLTSSIDQLENKTTYAYKGALMSAVVDPLNRRTEFYYSENTGRIASVLDAMGNRTQFTCNSRGDKTNITNPDGKQYSYTYDSDGNITASKDEMDYITKFEYDSSGNITKTTDAMGNTATTEYKNGNKVKTTDANGNHTVYEYDKMDRVTRIAKYDEMDRVTEITDPEDGATEYFYDYDIDDKKGSVIVRDPNGNETYIEYHKVLKKEVYIKESIDGQEDRITSMQYDANGNLTQVTHPDKSVQTFEYDAMNRVTKTKTGSSALFLETNYVYDKAGRLTSSSNTGGQKYSYTYDAVGNLRSTTDPERNTTSSKYDNLDRVCETTDANGYVSQIIYDNLGRIEKTIAADNTETEYEYNARGDMTAVINANKDKTEFCYNKAGKVTAQIEPDPEGKKPYVTSYTYDKMQNLILTVDPHNNKTEYKYNKLGKVCKIIDPNGAETILDYDKNGNHTSSVNANQHSSSMKYNQDNKVTQILLPSGLQEDFTYDTMSRLKKMTDSTGVSIEYEYDALGNIAEEKHGLIQKKNNVYNTLGQLTRSTGFDGESYSYVYDKLGRVLTETDPEGNTKKSAYDNNGNLKTVTEINGGVYSYEYDTMNRLAKVTDPLNVVTEYKYDSLGNLERIIDAKKGETKFEYDVLSRVTSVTDPNKARTSFIYDRAGNVIEETTPLGKKKLYEYDSINNLLKYQDEEGNIETYEYDGLKNRTKEISARNGITEYKYDANNQVVMITDAMENITLQERSPNGMLLKETLPNGAEYSYKYDELSRLIEYNAPGGQKRFYGYNAKGDLGVERDQSGRATSYEYDKMHRLTSCTNPEGTITSFNYDKYGNLEKVTTPGGASTSYSYDALNRVTTIQDPTNLLTSYSYDALGNIEQVIQNNSRTTSYGYDAVNNNTSIVNALGQAISMEYDEKNRLTKVTDTASRTTEFSYSPNGNLLSATDRNGQATSYAYDEEGNNTSVTDPEGRVINYAYDLLNKLTSVTEAEGITTHYSYDPVGNLTGKTDGNNHTTHYSYDLANRLTEIKNPLNEIREFQYNLEGNLSKFTNPNGSSIEYNYDALDTLISKSSSQNDVDAFYGYDEEGNMVSMSDLAGDTSYEYDLAGRITAVEYESGGRVEYTYDAYGNLETLTYPDGKCVSYTYDVLDRITGIKGRDGEITSYIYDEAGNMIRVNRPNGTFSVLEYDALGNVTKLSNVKTGTNKIISEFAYTYDSSGFITKEDAKQDGKTVTNEYEYDVRKQLIMHKITSPEGVAVSRYSYDNAGNRIRDLVTNNSGVIADVASEYNAADRLIKQINTAGYTRNIEYSYDANGNLIRKDTPNASNINYRYDSENRMSAILDKDNNLLFAALYDGNGDRVFSIAPKSNTGGWHDDWSDGSWENNLTQGSYNDTAFNYGVESEDPIEPEDFHVSSIDTENEKITCNVKNETGTVKYWFYVLKDGEVLYNSGGWRTASSADYSAPAGATIRVYCVDETLVKIVGIHAADENLQMPGASMHTPAVAENEANINTSLECEKDKIYDILFTQTGASKSSLEENYALTGYVNNINTAYTQVLMEYGPSGNVTSAYDYGVQRNAMSQSGNTYYYGYDGRGSVTDVMDSTGDVMLSYSYGAYGETTSRRIGHDNSVTNPYRYNAERTDDIPGVPGMQYLRSRYYNPFMGRFTTPDTYQGTLDTPLSQNNYTYVHNNPVMHTDPSGHFIVTLLIIGATVAVAGGTTYGVSNHYAEQAQAAYEASEKEYNAAKSELERINSGQAVIKDAHLGQLVKIAEYYNAQNKVRSSLEAMQKNAKDYETANKWKTIGFGAIMVGVGLMAISLAPALPTAVTTMAGISKSLVVGPLATFLFLKAPVIAGCIVGGATALFGVSEITEGITNYNPILEGIYGNNREAYELTKNILIGASFTVIIYGAMGAAMEADAPKAKTPKEIAQSWQGKGEYPGVDKYRNITIKKGTVIYRGEPKGTDYFTTKSAIERSGKNATKIFEGLQVQKHPIHGYRGEMQGYKVTSNINAASGIAKANPQFGPGGLRQVFIPNANDMISQELLVPVDKIPLTN